MLGRLCLTIPLDSDGTQALRFFFAKIVYLDAIGYVNFTRVHYDVLQVNSNFLKANEIAVKHDFAFC